VPPRRRWRWNLAAACFTRNRNRLSACAREATKLTGYLNGPAFQQAFLDINVGANLNHANVIVREEQ
jgi:hypothetical protein